ncbi:MAG: hypothetical protein HQL07_17035 [Nitrospirae bacterium]|nr:hypothetical protein [Magnetococcales bacterium]HAT50804.1 hypothetical protein [Alphaproteobacteria bacterium]
MTPKTLWKNLVSVNTFKGLLTLAVILGLVVFPAAPAAAFFTKLNYTTANHGAREIFSFAIPPGAQKPTLALTEPKQLLLTIPDILALPSGTFHLDQSRWIHSFAVASIPEAKMGLMVTIGLKQANLSFRSKIGPEDPVAGSIFEFEIDEQPKPDPTQPMEIREGLVLPGRDGTLLVLSHTGTTEIEKNIEKGANPVVRIHMKAAKLADTWRPLDPGGLVENVFVYEFPEGHAELEVLLNEKADAVHFYESTKAGYFIVEILGPRDIGRSNNAKQIIANREYDLEQGVSKPLHSIFPLYEPAATEVVLLDKHITEDYFWKEAKDAEKERHYDQARAYLGSLLDTFPDTPNREVIDFLMLDFHRRMGWKPGWLLYELEAVLARHPNTPNYSHYRFMQLKLLNESGRFESALSLMHDPNLPRDKGALLLENAKTNIGLANTHPGDPKFIQEAENHLQQVLSLTNGHGDKAASALFLLAKTNDLKQDHRAAIATLDQITAEHLGYLGKNPDHIMGIADIYYKYGHYQQAFQHYAMFMDAFHTRERTVPWAMLRAAEASFQLSRSAETQGRKSKSKEHFADAKRLFARLQKQFPGSDAAVWGKILELTMEQALTFKQRLEKLDQVIKTIALPNALAEAYLTRAELLGQDGQFRESLETLNSLLNMTQSIAVIRRADRLKKSLLVKGMAAALDEGRPEFASLLGEIYGHDWRQDPEFPQARIHLAEALMQLGSNQAAQHILERLEDPAAEALRQLAQTLIADDWLQSARKEGKLGGIITREVARVRLAEAKSRLSKNEWEAVQLILEPLPDGLLSEKDKDRRLRYMAKAELGRGRFPHAVKNYEFLLGNRPMGDGVDYYDYATVIQLWKGDEKALPSFVKIADEATDKEISALANIRVGDILQRNGDLEGAKGRYQKAAELAPGTSWAKISSENASQLEMALEVGR